MKYTVHVHYYDYTTQYCTLVHVHVYVLYVLSHTSVIDNSHITMITVQSTSTIVLLKGTVDYHLIKV